MADALSGLAHFLFHTYFGSRLFLCVIGYCALVFLAKRSYAAAVFIGRGMQVTGVTVAFAALYGMVVLPDHLTWLGIAILAVFGASFGVDILNMFAIPRPQSAAPVTTEMPVATADTYNTGGFATPEEIERALGGEFGIRGPTRHFED